MKFNPEIHHRRSIRLKGYDYSRNGAYFVTICSWNRECLFGEISGIKTSEPEIILNEYGKIVHDEWNRTVLIRKEIEIGEFIVMPNHFHGIVLIQGRGDRLVAPMSTIADCIQGRPPVAPTEDRPGPKPKSISSFLAGFKSIVTKRINELRQTPGAPVWQRNYYEHIIRNETELNRISQYIISNPANWYNDENNPINEGIKERLF
jgi:REP element-mobilizing transposase RayT